MDIDIDLPDRTKLLDLINYIPASIYRTDDFVKHNTGIYLQDVPKNPLTGLAVVDHKSAEFLGFFKFDLLNVHVYQKIKDNAHLEQLMNTEPVWELLNNREFVDMLIHINGHFDTLQRMEPVDSIEKMAMFLAVIRPAKRHLIGKSWDVVRETIWDKPLDGSYYFRKGHGISYSHLVVVHINLLAETI